MKLCYCFLLLLVGLFLVSCSEATKLSNRGYEQLENGDYHKASEYFQQALSKDSKNEKGLEGLAEVSTRVMDDYLNRFEMFYEARKFERAYSAMLEMRQYSKDVSESGLTCKIPEKFEPMMEETREIVANNYYESGIRLQSERDWKNAISEFEKSREVIENYEDTTNRLGECYINIGQNLMSKQNYRKAYYIFKRCLEINPGDLEAKSLKEESFEKGRIRIAIFKFENDTKVSDYPERLQERLLYEINQYGSEFIAISLEQKKYKENNIDEYLRKGYDYALYGEIKADVQTSDLQHAEVPCYRVWYTKQADSTQKKTNSSKTSWTYYFQERKVEVRTKWTLIDLADKILSDSGSEFCAASDEIEYGMTSSKYPQQLQQYDPNGSVWEVLGSSYSSIKSIGRGEFTPPPVDYKFFGNNVRKKLCSAKDITSRTIYKESEAIADKLCHKLDPKEYDL